METTTNNASLDRIVGMLQEQQAAKYDVVVNAANLYAEGGNIVIRQGHSQLDLDGVSTEDAWLEPTPVFDEGVSHRFSIPLKYVRRMRDEAAPLWDQNVNYWLQEQPDRRFLIRGFKTDNEPTGIARALMSDRANFKGMDNLDVLFAALQGIRDGGIHTEVKGADLTDKRMMVRFNAPEVLESAPELLQGYRSPFQGGGHGGAAAENPYAVSAGFVLKNSEVGAGAFTLVPRLTVLVCDNGMQVQVDAMREIHLGTALEEGVVKWSDGTADAAGDLIRAKTADVVRTVLDVDYLRKTLAPLREQADTQITDVTGTIERVSKAARFTEAEQDDILRCFIASGDTSAFGITQAVTAACQTWTPERRDEAELVAVSTGDAAMAAAV